MFKLFKTDPASVEASPSSVAPVAAPVAPVAAAPQVIEVPTAPSAAVAPVAAAPAPVAAAPVPAPVPTPAPAAPVSMQGMADDLANLTAAVGQMAALQATLVENHNTAVAALNAATTELAAVKASVASAPAVGAQVAEVVASVGIAPEQVPGAGEGAPKMTKEQAEAEYREICLDRGTTAGMKWKEANAELFKSAE